MKGTRNTPPRRGSTTRVILTVQVLKQCWLTALLPSKLSPFPSAPVYPPCRAKSETGPDPLPAGAIYRCRRRRPLQF